MSCTVEHTLNPRLNEVASNVDVVSRATRLVQGWFRRFDRKQSKRDLDTCEEGRLERMRIAGELHDTLLQGFLGASLVVSATVQEMNEDSPARASLNRAAQMMHGAIEEGRAVLQGLRSSVVASGPLERGFSDLLTGVAPACGVRARVVVTGRPSALRPEIQQQIYLIGREALVNALHHSTATSIEVEVAYLPSHLRVVVRDNGCGFDEQIMRSRRTSHWGLQGMRVRAKNISAEVRIYSRRGAGTEVEISLPSGIAAAA